MHRDSITAQMNHYADRYAGESETVERFLEFVSTNSDCFERFLSIGHVTGSAWLVNGVRSHVLLTHHRKLNRWLQLGGHADGESNTLSVAMREAEEESGLDAIQPVLPEIFDIDIHLIPARGALPDHYHYDVRYALQATASEIYSVSDESHDLRWVEIDRIIDFSGETSMLRMAEKWNTVKSWAYPTLNV